MSLHPNILSSIPTNFESFLIVLAVLIEISRDRLRSLMIVPIFFPKEARSFRQYLVFSVFPAPDSPEMTID